jgi:predicted metal-dependent hydrolase
VEIRLGRYQTINQALQHMRAKADRFARHVARVTAERAQDEDTRVIFGRSYDIVSTSDHNWAIDDEQGVIFRPNTATDDHGLLALEHHRFEVALRSLIDGYNDTDLVDIEGVTYTIRPMTSRYGSCRKQTRRITLNLHLIRYPLTVLDYVWRHEITHLVHANHGPEFYRLLGRLCPDHKRIRAGLRAGTL